MNVPHFNFDNLPFPDGSSDYVHAVLAEQHRVCDTIDARRYTLVNDFIAMIDEIKALELILEKTKGFFARWNVRNKIYLLNSRIDTNRDQRHELVCARIVRTYA